MKLKKEHKMKLKIEKEELTYGDLINLWNKLYYFNKINNKIELHPYLSNLKGFKLVYTIDRNIDRLRPIIKALEKIIEPSQKMAEFNQNNQQLRKRFALQNPDKSPVVVNDQFFIDPTQRYEFDKEYQILEEGFKEELKNHKEKIKNYEDMFVTVVDKEDFEFYMVDAKEVPKDLTLEQQLVIKWFIKGEPE